MRGLTFVLDSKSFAINLTEVRRALPKLSFSVARAAVSAGLGLEHFTLARSTRRVTVDGEAFVRVLAARGHDAGPMPLLRAAAVGALQKAHGRHLELRLRLASEQSQDAALRALALASMLAKSRLPNGDASTTVLAYLAERLPANALDGVAVASGPVPDDVMVAAMLHARFTRHEVPGSTVSSFNVAAASLDRAKRLVDGDPLPWASSARELVR